MRRTAIAALLGMLAAALIAPSQAAAAPSQTTRSAEYIVLYDEGASVAQARAAVQAAGGTIVSENTAVGVATVRTASAGFARAARSQTALDGVATNRSIGSVPRDAAGRDQVEKLTQAATGAAVGGAAGQPGAEPLARLQWDMRQIGATPDGAHAVEQGSPDVMVGIIDTGVDASHPDIAPNFNHELSRNFTTDIPVDAEGNEIDGPCEFEGCKDPADVDHEGHGSHVAGTVGAAANGIGIAGVAPKVSLVNLRAGQDSGFFFLQPTVDAITYAGDHGVDVVNMSFFVDPWLYNCGNNPADSPEEQAEQRATVEAVQRAVDYARERGVTLVSAAGNEAEDATKPVIDETSPNFIRTPGERPRTRRIDPDDCVTVPSGSEGVITVSATGPSGRKAYYSTFGLGFVDIAAPGGDAYDNPEQSLNFADAILSALPEAIGRQQGLINPDGTPATPAVVRAPDGSYYTYLQGTSMASPHVAGVAALIVSAFGDEDGKHGGLTLSPDEVEKRLHGTATPKPCPEPRAFTYTRNVVDPETNQTQVVTDTHVCEGEPGNNGFFGSGLVNAADAVADAKH